MAFPDKTWTLLRPYPPPSGFVLDLGMVWIILTWRSLKALALLKEDVLAHFRANFPSRIFVLDWRFVGTVIARTWLIFLLRLVWLVLYRLTHRES